MAATRDVQMKDLPSGTGGAVLVDLDPASTPRPSRNPRDDPPPGSDTEDEMEANPPPKYVRSRLEPTLGVRLRLDV